MYLKEKNIKNSKMGQKSFFKLNKENLISRLGDFFKSQVDVELAYLFGSTAEGSEGPLSDIDVGVYLSNKLTSEQRIEKRFKLTSELVGFLKTNNIDLVIMNDASLVINFEIIKPNIPLFIKNKDFKLDVEQRIMSIYLDRKYHEELLNRGFLERFKKRGGF